MADIGAKGKPSFIAANRKLQRSQKGVASLRAILEFMPIQRCPKFAHSAPWLACFAHSGLQIPQNPQKAFDLTGATQPVRSKALFPALIFFSLSQKHLVAKRLERLNFPSNTEPIHLKPNAPAIRSFPSPLLPLPGSAAGNAEQETRRSRQRHAALPAASRSPFHFHASRSRQPILPQSLRQRHQHDFLVSI